MLAYLITSFDSSSCWGSIFEHLQYLPCDYFTHVFFASQACLRTTKERVTSLMSTMTGNYAGLKQLQAGYRGEEIAQALKALSSAAETIMTLLTSIGAFIEFRRLLHQALADLFERKATGLTETLDLFCRAVGHGEVRDVNSQLVDLFAHDCGVVTSTYADPAFRSSINAMVVDPKAGERWELLPHAFACVFAASTWRDVEFSPTLGALSNNAHCMVAAMVALTHASRGAANGLADVADKKKKVCELFAETAKVSSAVLLRQFGTSKDRSRDSRSMFIFFDKLLTAIEVDYPSVRDHALPYSMIAVSLFYFSFRSCWLSGLENVLFEMSIFFIFFGLLLPMPSHYSIG